MTSAYLTVSGFVVTEAASGVDALVKAAQDLPAAMLMDFSMPGMDGATAARTLKCDPRTAGIPVIGLTPHRRGAGALDFYDVCEVVLEKPVSPETVLDALRRTLRRSDQSATFPPQV